MKKTDAISAELQKAYVVQNTAKDECRSVICKDPELQTTIR